MNTTSKPGRGVLWWVGICSAVGTSFAGLWLLSFVLSFRLVEREIGGYSKLVTRHNSIEAKNAIKAAVARLGGPRDAALKLERYLRAPGWAVRDKGGAALLLGGCGEFAVPCLIEVLRDPDPIIRVSGVMALSRIGPKARDAVPALEIVLSDSDGSVRFASAATLGRIGSDAEPSLPQLLLLFDQSRGDERLLVAGAIRDIGEDMGKSSDCVVSHMVTAFEDGDARIRLKCIEVLGKASQPNARVIATLIKALKDTDVFTQRAAAMALGRFGSAAKPARVALEEAARSEDEILREFANNALQEIRGGIEAHPVQPPPNSPAAFNLEGSNKSKFGPRAATDGQKDGSGTP